MNHPNLAYCVRRSFILMKWFIWKERQNKEDKAQRLQGPERAQSHIILLFDHTGSPDSRIKETWAACQPAVGHTLDTRYLHTTTSFHASQVVQRLWAIICWCRRCRFDPWVRKILWRRKWQPTPVFLPGKSHGQKSLTSYSPWSRKELDTTEHTHNTHTHLLSFSGQSHEVAIMTFYY